MAGNIVILLVSKARTLPGSILLFCALWLYSFDSVSARDEPSECQLHAAGYAAQFADLIKNENYSEMPGLLLQWEQICNESEPLFRARVLYLISERRFTEILNEQPILDNAIAFEIRHKLMREAEMQDIDDYFQLYPDYFGFVPMNSDFDRQTQQWARRLQSNVASGNLSYLFLQLWEGQTATFFKTLKAGYFQDTNLAKEYNEKLKENLSLPEFNLGLSAGIWVPTGDLSIIGYHPSIGINLGAKTQNTYWDAIFEFRYGNAHQDVEITVRDSLVTTRNYQGGYLGLEISHIIKRFASETLEIFAGGGYDIIDIVEDELDPQRQTFGSMALHVGIGYRLHFSNRSWLSIKPGYYFLNHKHATGSSLDGNALSLRLIFGFTENARKSENLKRLGVQQWW